jgi:hypothetical protein
MLLSHHQNAGENRDINISNGPFENVFLLKYLGMTVANQNLIQEEIMRRINLDNACYNLVQNILSSHMLSKNIKVRIQKT